MGTLARDSYFAGVLKVDVQDIKVGYNLQVGVPWLRQMLKLHVFHINFLFMHLLQSGGQVHKIVLVNVFLD